MAFEVKPLDPITFAKYWTPQIIEAAIQGELHVPDYWLEEMRSGKSNRNWIIDEARGWAATYMGNEDRLRVNTTWFMITLAGDYCVYRYAGGDHVQDAIILSVDLVSSFFHEHKEDFIKAATEAFVVGGENLHGGKDKDGKLILPFDHKLIFINL